MSRKVNPTALRVGFSKSWTSQWYAEDARYADAVIEDDKIRSYLKKSLKAAGVESVLIERSIKTVKIIVRVSRPGIVIGRKGAGLAQMRIDLAKITKADLDLQIEEVKKPEASAPVVAQTIATQLERRVHAKRAMNSAADAAMDAGAGGIKIELSGTLQGPNTIGTSEIVSRGAVPTQTIRADIDFAKAVALTRGGTIGVKVWVNKGEIETA